jgi:protein AFG1
LSTIELLKQRCQVHALSSPLDYRKMEREQLGVFYYPLDSDSQQSINYVFSHLTKGHRVHPHHIPLWGRQLKIPHYCKGIAKISFGELCGAPHSAADFLALVSEVHTLILTDIPRLTLKYRNEARRFITLIDTLYENKVNFLLSKLQEYDSSGCKNWKGQINMLC